MFKIIDIASAATVPMEPGRGDTVKLVDGSLGTDKLDLHLNRLLPNGPHGKLHRHSMCDNVYIVRKGRGNLRVEDRTYTISEGQVVYIGAGTPHALGNASQEETFEIFEIYAPAGKALDFEVL